MKYRAVKFAITYFDGFGMVCIVEENDRQQIYSISDDFLYSDVVQSLVNDRCKKDGISPSEFYEYLQCENKVAEFTLKKCIK